MNSNSADLNSPQESHLRKLLDALRPGSDDLSRSEFAELAARLQRDPQFKEIATRSQRLDLAISDAMHDLPIPAGSVDRLLARLDVQVGPAKQASKSTAASVGLSADTASSGIASAAKSSSSNSPPSDAQAVSPKPVQSNTAKSNAAHPDEKPHVVSPSRESTWRWIGVGALATAASLAVIAYLFSGSRVEFNAGDVVAEAQEFARDDQGDDWQPLPANPTSALLTRFAASGALTVKPTAWREVRGLLGRNGVAYELRSGVVRATLYVVEQDPPARSAPRFVDLPISLPADSMTDSGNRAFSTWSEGDRLLYVLVVDGGPQQYKAFVAQPGRLAAL